MYHERQQRLPRLASPGSRWLGRAWAEGRGREMELEGGYWVRGGGGAGLWVVGGHRGSGWLVVGGPEGRELVGG